jgi:hypothetical protein
LIPPRISPQHIFSLPLMGLGLTSFPLGKGVPYMEPTGTNDLEMLRAQGLKFEIIYKKQTNKKKKN